MSQYTYPTYYGGYPAYAGTRSFVSQTAVPATTSSSAPATTATPAVAAYPYGYSYYPGSSYVANAPATTTQATNYLYSAPSYAGLGSYRAFSPATVTAPIAVAPAAPQTQYYIKGPDGSLIPYNIPAGAIFVKKEEKKEEEKKEEEKKEEEKKEEEKKEEEKKEEEKKEEEKKEEKEEAKAEEKKEEVKEAVQTKAVEDPNTVSSTNFSVTVIDASDLPSSWTDKTDPYVEVTINGVSKKTSVKEDAGKQAVWNETLIITAASSSTSGTIKVFDKDVASNDDVIGSATFSITSGQQSITIFKNGSSKGVVRISMP